MRNLTEAAAAGNRRGKSYIRVRRVNGPVTILSRRGQRVIAVRAFYVRETFLPYAGGF
jgi:hypothetical protein